MTTEITQRRKTDELVEFRLDRIERGIEGLTEVVVNLAKLEERVIAYMEMASKQAARIDALEEKQSAVIERISRPLWVANGISVLMGIMAAAAVSSYVSKLVGGA